MIGESRLLEFCALLHRPLLASSMKGGICLQQKGYLSGLGELSASLCYFISIAPFFPFISFFVQGANSTILLP
jgi:hypothetical protein